MIVDDMPEKDFYITRIRCIRCGALSTESIPKSMTISDFMIKNNCKACGGRLMERKPKI